MIPKVSRMTYMFLSSGIWCITKSNKENSLFNWLLSRFCSKIRIFLLKTLNIGRANNQISCLELCTLMLNLSSSSCQAMHSLTCKWRETDADTINFRMRTESIGNLCQNDYLERNYFLCNCKYSVATARSKQTDRIVF